MRKMILSGLMIATSFTGMAQSLEKMQWFNEPEQWKIENNTLAMNVTPQTDYWRISHYPESVIRDFCKQNATETSPYNLKLRHIA